MRKFDDEVGYKYRNDSDGFRKKIERLMTLPAYWWVSPNWCEMGDLDHVSENIHNPGVNWSDAMIVIGEQILENQHQSIYDMISGEIQNENNAT